MSLKGELFSQDMVRAYLEGRKRHTARPVKPQPPETLQYPYGFITGSTDRREVGKFCWAHGEICDGRVHTVLPKYQPGDYIYCRETWRLTGVISAPYAYFADESELRLIGESGEHLTLRYKWRPSLHMSREAARLFFRVTKVQAMRLDDVDEQFARQDGFQAEQYNEKCGDTALDKFMRFWETTYGPAARWMWVYWTEPVTREKAYVKS